MSALKSIYDVDDLSRVDVLVELSVDRDQIVDPGNQASYAAAAQRASTHPEVEQAKQRLATAADVPEQDVQYLLYANAVVVRDAKTTRLGTVAQQGVSSRVRNLEQRHAATQISSGINNSTQYGSTAYDGPSGYATSQNGINSRSTTQSGTFTGEGVTVGIFDTGINHSDLNDDVAAFQDVDDNSINDNDSIHDEETHGTRVAGMVERVAPDSEYYIASSESYDNFPLAMEWFLRNDVDVISLSFGELVESFIPQDGTDATATTVTEAVEASQQFSDDPTIVSVAAGNDADNAATGSIPATGSTQDSAFIDPTSGGITAILTFNDTVTATPTMNITGPNGTTYQPVSVVNPAPNKQGVLIEEPGATAAGRYEINVFTQGNQPVGRYHVELVSSDQNNNFEQGEFGTGAELTVSSPATSKEALTVGAVNNNRFAAGFSARGPLWDGTVKPDVVAPGVAVSAPYPPRTCGSPPCYDRTSGTSFAQPLVAGVIAQYTEMYRAAHGRDPTPRQIKAVMMNAGETRGQRSTTAKNINTGTGVVDSRRALTSFVFNATATSSRQFTNETHTPQALPRSRFIKKGTVYWANESDNLRYQLGTGGTTQQYRAVALASTSASTARAYTEQVNVRQVDDGEANWALATNFPPRPRPSQNIPGYQYSDPASLDEGESAAYALAVSTQLPSGRFVSDRGAVRALSYTNNGDVNISVYDPSGTVDSRSTISSVDVEQTISSDQSPSRVIVPPSTQPAPVSGEWKVVYAENSSSGGATFSPAVNYPVEPLPSEASILPGESDVRAGNASDPGKINVTLTVETANQPYSFQGFGKPDGSHFDVTVGLASIDSKNITVNQVNKREDKYRLIAPAPKQPDSGEYNLSIEFTDTKLNASHTATADGVNVTYTSGGTATGRTATSLIIDDSGSMGGQKIQDAKDAGTEYIRTVDDSAAVGVARFDGSASPAHPMVIVATNESSLESSIRGLRAGGSTNIGGGMNVGLDLLGDAPGNATKAAILLSDGQQNTGPNPQQVADKYNNSDIPVYTIALGSGADDPTLRSIARTTGGEFYQTFDSATLGNIYNDIRTTVSQSSTFHTASGTLTQNSQVTNSFGVGGGVDSTNVRVQLGNSASGSSIQAVRADASVGALQTQSGKPTVRLRYPNGTTVSYNTTGELTVVDPGIDYVNIGDTVVYQLDNPQRGNWSYTVVNDQSAQLDYSAQVTGNAIASLSTSTDANQYVTGSRATLSTSLVGDTGGISGATVTANVTLPDGNTTTVSLAEQTTGTYTADLPVTQAGRYQATITARAGSLSRQRQVQWTVVSQSSVLSVDPRTSGATPSVRQGGQVSTVVNLSRPATSTTATTGLDAAGPSTATGAAEFEEAVAEVAASDPGTYDESAVDPAVRRAAEAVRDSGANVSEVDGASAQATSSGGTVAAYLSAGDLTGPNGATIDQSRVFLSSTVVRLSPGEQQQLDVTVQLPQSTTTGTYTGELTAYVGGTAVTGDISINVTQADSGTYRARIVNFVPQWQSSGPQGKAYYETRMADQLTYVYFNESTGQARTKLQPTSTNTLRAPHRESRATPARAEVAR